VADKTFLLVAEGETDIIIFQVVAKHLSSKQVTINIKSLAPQKDVTSTGYPPHGFGEVQNWCIANKNKIQMLIDFSGANGLLVQMDTDIALQINKGCTKTPRECCTDKLNEAFATIKEPNRCRYILPTQNTETWLLASHGNYTALDSSLREVTDFESLSDTEERLVALGYPSKKVKTGRKKLSKKPRKYHAHGQQLINNLPLARIRCQELDRLCDILAHS
jgi:hypothetical protein